MLTYEVNFKKTGVNAMKTDGTNWVEKRDDATSADIHKKSTAESTIHANAWPY